ncbi:hypothetical protein M5K25_014083 [Dendrobium thyrsiflorum]|uniref:Uncharacterized protein n=1 Tax=Dendrobium thyrsiflorum TaxID=117978 RepID=A0ABD0UV33_DENTH
MAISQDRFGNFPRQFEQPHNIPYQRWEYRHEMNEQIKMRLQQAYEQQISSIFPDEDMESHRSDDVVDPNDRWNHLSHMSTQSNEVGPSHRPGKAPLTEVEDFLM